MIKYYKIIDEINNSFVGVGTSQSLRYFQIKHNVLLTCSERKAQCIEYKEELYRDSWMKPFTSPSIKCKFAKVIEITEEEYDALSQSINSGEDIIIEESPIEENFPSIEEETPPLNEQLTLEYVRDKKIKEMNLFCKKSIIDGVDVLLTNKSLYHFDLTIEDQLNINNLKYLLSQGEVKFIYHSKGGLFKYYSKEDIQLIISATDNHILYHNSYFNSLKLYINSLTDITEISSIQYGQDFSDSYKSDVLLSFKNQLIEY